MDLSHVYQGGEGKEYVIPRGCLQTYIYYIVLGNGQCIG